MRPRGHPRGQGRPQGLHFFLVPSNFVKFFLLFHISLS